MTVPSTTRRAGPYYGNGVTTAFPFTFKVFATTDIALTLTAVDGIATALVLDTDYSVALNPDQDTSPGGTITYPLSGDPLATGETLVGVGALPYDQTTDFPAGGNYRASTHENTFDRTVFQIQQLAEAQGRSLTLPPSASSADTELPAPVAGNVIGWNETADALVNYTPADLATVVISGTSYFDVFNGTGAQTQFVLTANPGSVNALDVAVDGVPQKNGIDFTISGTTLTFTSAPAAGTQNVAVRYVAAVPVGSANAQDVTFLQAGTGAVPRTVQDDLREWVKITQFGGSRSASTVVNRAALQAAIAAVDVLGGGTVLVPGGVDYGFVNNNIATYPSFVGVVNDVTVVDEGIGDADGSGNKAGAQTRHFFYTKQTTPYGQHDGNGYAIAGDWHPYYSINNIANIQAVGHPSRLATDNRRASVFIYNDGRATWRMGQGALAGAGYTNEELSNFCIQHFQTPGDALADYSPLIIERKTGNWAVGLSSNAPGASYHFKSVTTGTYQAVFESLTTMAEVYLRTSNGTTDDAGLRNTAGDISLRISTQGDALTVAKSNRRVTAAQSFVQKRVIVTYSASMTVDAALGNLFTITATNGSAFAVNAPTNPADGQIIYVKTANTSGGALGAITPNAVFKLVGGAWPSPSTGNNITLTLAYDGANWVEVSRSGTVPN